MNPYSPSAEPPHDGTTGGKYYARLVQYRREGGPSFWNYYGSHWLLMKIVLGILAAFCFYRTGTPDYIGWAIIGYLAGVFASSVKTLRAHKLYWPYLDRVVDWTSVAEHRESAPKDGG